jgi:hypothetical protein
MWRYITVWVVPCVFKVCPMCPQPVCAHLHTFLVPVPVWQQQASSQQHTRQNCLKSRGSTAKIMNLEKPIPKPSETRVWQIWCPYGHSSNQDTVHEQAESFTSYDTRQFHWYTCVCPHKWMGLRNHIHTHACWMLLHARHSLRHQDSSNITKNWPKTHSSVTCQNNSILSDTAVRTAITLSLMIFVPP